MVPKHDRMVYLVNCDSTPFQRFDSLNANDHKMFVAFLAQPVDNAIFTWVLYSGVEINQFKFVVGYNVTKRKKERNRCMNLDAL